MNYKQYLLFLCGLGFACQSGPVVETLQPPGRDRYCEWSGLHPIIGAHVNLASQQGFIGCEGHSSRDVCCG